MGGVFGFFCLIGKSVVQVLFTVFKDALGTEQEGSTIVVTSTVKGKYVCFYHFKILFSPVTHKEKRRLDHIYLHPA